MLVMASFVIPHVVMATADGCGAWLGNGVKREKNGKHQDMDAYAHVLRADQIDALVGYIRSLAK